MIFDKHSNSIKGYGLLITGFLLLIGLLPNDVYAVTADPSAANIFNALENTTARTLVTTLSNLLAEGSPVIQFARSLFIGLAVVMLVLYLVQFAREGTDALDTNGIFFFIVTVVIVNAFLYLPATAVVNGETVSTLWIGKVAIELYSMSTTSGQIFYDAATGGIFPAGEGIEPLFKILFRIRFIDQTSGIGGTIGFYIITFGIVAALALFVALIWVITSIIPVAIAVMGVFLVLTLPLLLFPFGKSIFQSSVSIIIGLQAAILAEWLAAAFCMNMFGDFLTTTLTMGFLEVNFIDVPIETVVDAAGILILVIVCIILAIILPTIAGGLAGSSTGNIGSSALRAIRIFRR